MILGSAFRKINLSRVKSSDSNQMIRYQHHKILETALSISEHEIYTFWKNRIFITRWFIY